MSKIHLDFIRLFNEFKRQDRPEEVSFTHHFVISPNDAMELKREYPDGLSIGHLNFEMEYFGVPIKQDVNHPDGSPELKEN